MNNFIEITNLQHAKYIIENLNYSDILLFSKTSIEKIGEITTRATSINGQDFHSQVEKIDAFITRLPKDTNAIYTFGGGTIIDAGKYIANELDTRLTCILPMLSTNTFATDKVSLYLADNTKATLQAKLPDEIILDMDLIKAAGHKNLLGLSEILSIHTALYDWDLGVCHNNEQIDTATYITALDILHDLNENIEEILALNEDSIWQMYRLIGKSGELTRIYGSGRPESGSEHILAKVIERELALPHGLAVAIGVIGMSILQDNNSEFAINLLRKIGTLRLLDNHSVTNQDIASALLRVKRANTRFTILDIKSIDEYFIRRVISKLDELRQ